MTTLPNGLKLGHYEITGHLGAGGMGEVYRAVDKRLDRVVAIKVLPAHLSERSDLRTRFEREARTISSLNHPHICTLFDVGEHNGSAFLVMELLEGESLSERLTRGPLPVRQAIKFATEIADALDRAHSQNIVHRDLKPGNVMIGKSGVKLLDFGLAKLRGTTGGLSQDSPTEQHAQPVTAEGSIVGTLQYMAPEQLEGKEADARTDIFALGVTMYEMLSGRRPFDGASQAKVIANILHEDPAPLLSLQPAVPPALARLINHCLSKDPDQRWQTARDVALQLRGMSEASSSEIQIAPLPPARRWLRIAIASLSALALLAAAFILGRRKTATQDRFTHFSIASPENQHFTIGADSSILTVSRDGRKVVFSAAGADARTQLYLRDLSSFETRPVPHSDGAINPFFAPDGNSVAFYAGTGELRRVSLIDGTEQKICSAGPGMGGSWSSEEVIYFNPTPGGVIARVAAGGGTPVALTEMRAGEGSHGWPDLIEGEQVLLYTAEVQGKPLDEAEIIAWSLSKKKRNVVARGTYPRYVEETGQLLFGRNDKLWAVAFNPETLAVTGSPKVVSEELLISPGGGGAAYDVDERGDIFILPTDDRILSQQLVWIDRKGTRTSLPIEPRPYHNPRLSADGRKLSLELIGANNDVWIADLERSTVSRLTSQFENLAPIISPDGRFVVVSRYQGNTLPQLVLLRTDGQGEAEPLFPPGPNRTQFAYSWTADGAAIGFVDIGVGDVIPTGSDISLLKLAPRREIISLLKTKFEEGSPAISPDGRWIAYVSTETGNREVHLRAIAGDTERFRVSTDGGAEPVWAHSGRELFYRVSDSLMSVSIDTTPSLKVGVPVKLFETRFAEERHSGITRSYDVAPDDSRFIVLERAPRSESVFHMNVLVGALGKK